MPSEQAEAARLRDEGAARAVEHADAVFHEWSAVAYSALLRFLLKTPLEDLFGFTAEDVRGASPEVPEPPDRRAWGHVMLRAARAKLISQDGYRTHRARSRHCGISTVWKRARQ